MPAFPTPEPHEAQVILRVGDGSSGSVSARGFVYRGIALACWWTVLALQGCALAGGPPRGPSSPDPGVSPEEVAPGWVETGIASWYGAPFHGRPTASGERYDQEGATGAHRTLPFGTRIQVENLDNGRSAVLTVNDRGPFVDDRILDVSRRVARELRMLGPGTARVRITVLDAPVPTRCWMVQVGAFAEEPNAARLRDRLEADGLPVQIMRSMDGLFRVQVGPFPVRADAERIRAREGGFLMGCAARDAPPLPTSNHGPPLSFSASKLQGP